MNDDRDDEFGQYRAGLELLNRISETGAALTSEDVAGMLGAGKPKREGHRGGALRDQALS